MVDCLRFVVDLGMLSYAEANTKQTGFLSLCRMFFLTFFRKQSAVHKVEKLIFISVCSSEIEVAPSLKGSLWDRLSDDLWVSFLLQITEKSWTNRVRHEVDFLKYFLLIWGSIWDQNLPQKSTRNQRTK